MKFKIIILIVFIVFLASVAGGVFLRVNRDAKRIKRLEKEVKNLKGLKIREQEIDRIARTLLVHYCHLSRYEAHYYAIVFYDFSKKYEIPWELYAAVVRIESNFNPSIRSNKGAKGITQVIESTGAEVAEKLDIEYEKGATLWNDILNLVIGFTYLSEGVKELGIEDGLKRYNGGPGFKKGHKVIGRYRTTVWQEYVRLKYLYRSNLLDKKEPVLLLCEKEE